MAGTTFSNLKRRVRAVLDDGRALGSLVRDPVLSQTYYPESARKSKGAVLADLVWWRLRHGEVNRYYYLYGLDRIGTNAGAVMPYARFRAMRDSRNLRPAGLSAYYGVSYNFVCVLRDKFLFSRFASSLGFPVSKLFAICSSESVHWVASGSRAPLEELASDPHLVIDGIAKPIDGIMGGGIFPLRIEHGRMLMDGKEAPLEELRRRFSRRYVLEERLTQHPELASLHMHSINTLRLVTFNRNGAVDLFCAALRIGTGGRATDNWSAGGVLVAVDPATGTARGDGFMKPSFGRRVSHHPDSGVRFDGFAIPDFERAVALVKQFHACLPGLHSIGWDVAITPQGPVVIEGNDDWDGAIPMLFEPCFREKFTRMF